MGAALVIALAGRRLDLGLAAREQLAAVLEQLNEERGFEQISSGEVGGCANHGDDRKPRERGSWYQPFKDQYCSHHRQGRYPYVAQGHELIQQAYTYDSPGTSRANIGRDNHRHCICVSHANNAKEASTNHQADPYETF